MINFRLLVVLLAFSIPLNCNAQNSPDSAPKRTPIKINTVLTPNIGGIKQFLEIKTDDANKPVLLFLSGGPGSSMANNSDSFTNILKERFTIVQWDQRNAGQTLKLNASPTRPSILQMQRDAHEVIAFLIKELNQEKIYLLGSSWGNVLGFYIVKNHPEVLRAYFAVNPVVSQLASEKDLLKTLKMYYKTNLTASKELDSVNIPFKNEEDLFFLRKWLLYKEGNEVALSGDFKVGLQ
jgi:pimeloyl-ACP methyl ester carboxylesterase